MFVCRVHLALASPIPRDRFALLLVDHELFQPSVLLFVTIATMLGIAPPDWKELHRSFRAESVVRFHELPSPVFGICDSIVPLASAPVLPPPHPLPAIATPVAAREANPRACCTQSLPKSLQWLNAVPAAREPDSAKSFHLFLILIRVSDCPGPDFPKESLYSQWEYVTRNAA